VTVVQQPANGSNLVNGTDGVITYTPDTGFTGEDVFTYTVHDNLSATSNEATVTVTVNASGGGATNLLSDPECNGPFSSTGTDGWKKTESGDASISFSSLNPLSGSSSILIHNPTVKSYNAIQVEQKFDLTAGHDYQITLLTKNTNLGSYEGTVDIYAIMSPNWQPQGAWKKFPVTDQKNKFSHTFTANHSAQSVMWLQLGTVVGDFQLDSVWVVDLTGGVSNESPNLFSNGNFDEALDLNQGSQDRWEANDITAPDYISYDATSPIGTGQAIKIDKDNQGVTAKLKQKINLQAGITYVFEADVYNPGGFTGSVYIDNYRSGGC
jgi:hypothetical protein